MHLDCSGNARSGHISPCSCSNAPTVATYHRLQCFATCCQQWQHIASSLWCNISTVATISHATCRQRLPAVAVRSCIRSSGATFLEQWEWCGCSSIYQTVTMVHLSSCGWRNGAVVVAFRWRWQSEHQLEWLKTFMFCSSLVCALCDSSSVKTGVYHWFTVSLGYGACLRTVAYFLILLVCGEMQQS